MLLNMSKHFLSIHLPDCYQPIGCQRFFKSQVDETVLALAALHQQVGVMTHTFQEFAGFFARRAGFQAPLLAGVMFGQPVLQLAGADQPGGGILFADAQRQRPEHFQRGFVIHRFAPGAFIQRAGAVPGFDQRFEIAVVELDAALGQFHALAFDEG